MAPTDYTHRVEILEDVVVGNEDGTPLTERQPVWEGVGTLDEHRAYSRPAEVDTKTVQTAVVFVPWDCPVGENHHLRVTRLRVSGHDEQSTWRVDNIEDFDPVALMPEREVQVTRVLSP